MDTRPRTPFSVGFVYLSSDEEVNREITLKDLYKLTLSVKKGLSKDITTQKRKTEELEDENQRLNDEIKEQGKVIQQLTARVETCKAKAKFYQLQIDENRDDIEKIDDKHHRYNLVIYGFPEEKDKSGSECVKELFVELGLLFGVNHADAIYRIGPAKNGKKKLQRPILSEVV